MKLSREQFDALIEYINAKAAHYSEDALLAYWKLEQLLVEET